MALTQNEKTDVYMTVSIELVRMFDILNNSYLRPHETEKALLIGEIEKGLSANWEVFKLP